MKTKSTPRPTDERPEQPVLGRKPFTPPTLEQHERLPEMTGISDCFPGTPNC